MSRQPLPHVLAGRVRAGQRVRAARWLAGGLTQREVAKRTGMSTQHIAAVEPGREPLLPSDLAALERELACPSGWLLRGWTCRPDAAGGIDLAANQPKAQRRLAAAT